MPGTEQRARFYVRRQKRTATAQGMQKFAKKHTSQLHKRRESDGWKQRTHNACRWSECLARCSKVHGKGAGEVEAKQGQVRNRCPGLRTPSRAVPLAQAKHDTPWQTP